MIDESPQFVFRNYFFAHFHASFHLNTIINIELTSSSSTQHWTMPSQTATPLPFNCATCSKPITNHSAILTSCGHFFCVSPPAICTSLSSRHQQIGKCEACGTQCSTISLANQETIYDNNVRSFIFGNPTETLQAVIDSLEFRDKQRKLLSDNANKYQQIIHELRKEISELHNRTYSRLESEKLQRDNEVLKRENDHLCIQLESKNKEIETLLLHTSTSAHHKNNNKPSSSPMSMTTKSHNNTNTMYHDNNKTTSTYPPLSRAAITKNTNNNNHLHHHAIPRSKSRSRTRSAMLNSTANGGTSKTRRVLSNSRSARQQRQLNHHPQRQFTTTHHPLGPTSTGVHHNFNLNATPHLPYNRRSR